MTCRSARTKYKRVKKEIRNIWGTVPHGAGYKERRGSECWSTAVIADWTFWGYLMNELLGRILDAHGGLERWNGCKKVDATIVSGGGFFPLKGVPQDPSPRPMTAWLHEERSSVWPFGAPGQRTMFTPDRIAIEKLDGEVVAERRAPMDSFAGHDNEHALGRASSCLFQWRSRMDLSHPPFFSR
jgi:hypothetical protein